MPNYKIVGISNILVTFEKNLSKLKNLLKHIVNVCSDRKFCKSDLQKQ
jgi:hypothetical protein